MRTFGTMALALMAGPALAGAAHAASQGEPITIKGELIDTWCYLSGVMGGPEAVVGTAHHTCAMWCAAGGIPVGVLAEDGTVYMVLKLPGAEGQGDVADSYVTMTNDTVEAKGTAWERDGVRYLVVAEVLANEGIPNRTHEEIGVIPGFVIPDKVVDGVLEGGQ